MASLIFPKLIKNTMLLSLLEISCEFKKENILPSFHPCLFLIKIRGKVFLSNVVSTWATTSLVSVCPWDHFWILHFSLSLSLVNRVNTPNWWVTWWENDIPCTLLGRSFFPFWPTHWLILLLPSVQMKNRNLA